MLDSSGAGLPAGEAARRLSLYGQNQPLQRAARQGLLRFIANFTHTLALLLWFAAGLAFAAGIPALGGAIVAVVAVNGVFAFVQEYRAARVIEALMRTVAIRSVVRRDGRSAYCHRRTSCRATSSGWRRATSCPRTACCCPQTT